MGSLHPECCKKAQTETQSNDCRLEKALKTLKEMAPSPLAPLKIAVVGVLACVDYAEVFELIVLSTDFSLINNSMVSESNWVAG